MKPVQNSTHQQINLPPLPPATAESENTLLCSDTSGKEGLPVFAVIPPKDVDDPAQWDEAWFSNYE